jgi:hypothetical protein
MGPFSKSMGSFESNQCFFLLNDLKITAEQVAFLKMLLITQIFTGIFTGSEVHYIRSQNPCFSFNHPCFFSTNSLS